jgi:hypothetical protein
MTLLTSLFSNDAINGKVDTYAELPDATTRTNQIWVVLTGNGKGFYQSDGVVWSLYVGSNSVFDGKVDNFASLPPVADHNGETYYVKSWSIANPTKLAGLYLSDGVNWDRRSDKVVYSLLNFAGANRIVKTNNANKEIIETAIEIDASNNLDLKAGGLKDTNVVTAVALGSATDISLNTTKNTLIGAINELLLDKVDKTSFATSSTAGIAQLATQAQAIAGTAGLMLDPSVLLSLFNSGSLSTKGFARLPVNMAGAFTEIFLQWGITGPVNQDSYVTDTFATSFSSNVFGVFTCPTSGVYGGQGTFSVENITISGFTYFNGADLTTTVRWLAIGY